MCADLTPYPNMNLSPFHYARALFRAACGLPPRGISSREASLDIPKKTLPHANLFRGIMETTSPTVLGPVPMETYAATMPPAVDQPTPKASGFLRLEVDNKKKALGSFLLFSNGQVLSGTVEGAASELLGDHVETSFRLQPRKARRLGAGQAVPVTVRCLRFQACDH